MTCWRLQYLRHNKVTPCLARGGYDLSIFGAKVTQDFPGGAGDLKILVLESQDSSTTILVPGSCLQDLGTKIFVPRSWYQDLGTKILRSGPGCEPALTTLAILWFKWGFPWKSAPYDLIGGTLGQEGYCMEAKIIYF